MDFTNLDQNRQAVSNNLSFSTMVQQETEELRIKVTEEATKANQSEDSFFVKSGIDPNLLSKNSSKYEKSDVNRAPQFNRMKSLNEQQIKAKASEHNTTRLTISQKATTFKKRNNIVSIKSLKVICFDCG